MGINWDSVASLVVPMFTVINIVLLVFVVRFIRMGYGTAHNSPKDELNSYGALMFSAVILALYSAVVMGWSAPQSEAEVELLKNILLLVAGYWIGSSRSSTTKDNAIAAATTAAATTATTAATVASTAATVASNKQTEINTAATAATTAAAAEQKV
jgi:hypothetical protein